MDDSEQQVAAAAAEAALPGKRARRTAQARLVPRRTAVLSPTAENAPAAINARIAAAKLPPWRCFGPTAAGIWRDRRAHRLRGSGTIGPGPRAGGTVAVARMHEYFAAHAELGYAELIDPANMIGRRELVRDLRRLGVASGMDLMVHSSLSAIGFVEGGAETSSMRSCRQSASAEPY